MRSDGRANAGSPRPFVVSPALAITVAVLVLLGVFAFLLNISLSRLIARDEGFYLMAAKLVAQGNTPYLDFFFPQTPLSAYFFSPLFLLGVDGWMAARFLAAIVATAIVAVVGYIAYRRSNLACALVAVTMLATSSFFFPWFLTVRTYGLSVLLLLLSFLALSTYRALFVSAVLFGLAISARLMFAPLILILLYEILQQREFRNWRAFLMLGSGVLLGLLPVIALTLMAPESSWFGNIEYHLLRSTDSAAMINEHRLKVAKIVLGLRATDQFNGLDFPALFWINLIAVVVSLIKRHLPDSASLAALLLFCINLIPSPTYVQYFCTLTPFLVLGATTLCWRWWNGAPSNSARAIVIIFAIALLPWHFASLAKNIEMFTQSGAGVIGIGSGNAKLWSLDNVATISAKINSLTRPNEYLVTNWPGYLIATHAQPLPTLENQFGLSREIREQLTPQRRERLHLPVLANIRALLSRDSAINLGISSGRGDEAKDIERLLRESGFEPKRSEQVKWFVREK